MQILDLSSIYLATRGIKLMAVWLTDYISNSLSTVKQRGVILLLSFVLMNVLASAAPPPTPPFNTSLFMSFCPFLIVWGSCSNSINSHSLWWLVPVHWWPGGCTVVCCSEVALSCSVWIKILKMRKAGSVVGHVWLYTLTAGGIKITYLDVRNKWHAAKVRETQWVLFIKQKYKTF